MKHDKTFEEFLKHSNLSQNTQTSYLRTIKYYTENYDSFSKENFLAYKGFLMEYFKSKTLNLRLQGINKYLQYIHKEELQLKFVKVQQENFLENVISNADYQFLKTQLKKDNNLERYFVVWFLAGNGARVSELVQIKVEHVRFGYFDLYSKGRKLRRLYISKIRASFLLRGESQTKSARPSVFGRWYNTVESLLLKKNTSGGIN